MLYTRGKRFFRPPQSFFGCFFYQFKLIIIYIYNLFAVSFPHGVDVVTHIVTQVVKNFATHVLTHASAR